MLNRIQNRPWRISTNNLHPILFPLSISTHCHLSFSQFRTYTVRRPGICSFSGTITCVEKKKLIKTFSYVVLCHLPDPDVCKGIFSQCLPGVAWYSALLPQILRVMFDEVKVVWC